MLTDQATPVCLPAPNLMQFKWPESELSFGCLSFLKQHTIDTKEVYIFRLPVASGPCLQGLGLPVCLSSECLLLRPYVTWELQVQPGPVIRMGVTEVACRGLEIAKLLAVALLPN